MSRGTTIGRRELLAGSTSFAMTPLLRTTVAPPSFALTPDYRVAWRAQRSSLAGQILQLPTGVRVTTPSTSIAAVADAGEVALWAATPESGDWRLAFDYRVVARSTLRGGSFTCLYFDTVGLGQPGFPAAVPSWVVRQPPNDFVYMPHARGLRFSFATWNPSAPQDHLRFRLRWFDGSAPPGTLIGAPSAQLFPFTTGQLYRVTVARTPAGIGVATDAVLPSGSSVHATWGWADARIGAFGSGFLGFRWRGQSAELTNLSFAQLP